MIKIEGLKLEEKPEREAVKLKQNNNNWSIPKNKALVDLFSLLKYGICTCYNFLWGHFVYKIIKKINYYFIIFFNGGMWPQGATHASATA